MPVETPQSAFSSLIEFVEALPCAAVALDRDLRFIAVNEAWAKDHRQPREQILGSNAWDAWGMTEMPKGFIDVLAGKTVTYKRVRHVLHDGAERYADMGEMPWRDE